MADLSLLDAPIRVGPATLRGRVYVPAHQPGLAEGGVPGPRYIAYQRARARAGVAMQVTGATPVVPSGVWHPSFCLHNVDDRIVPGYQRLAEAVHAEGGRMLAQLAHPGPTESEGPDVIGPSHLFSEINRAVVRPATAGELEEVVERFAAAARRCREGGLDGVEITMAHGLLLAAFLSPLMNHREDEYGGTLDGRMRFPLAVLDAVRAACGPEMIVGVRLGVDDLRDGGLRPPDGAEIARRMEDRVDYLSVMVGNNNWLEPRVRHWPPTPAPHGLFRGVARTIREAVSVPVCAVGRITSPALAADILASGDADLVGMVRAHIADPELLAKARAGRSRDIRPCVGANLCINRLLDEAPIECLANPDVGRELDTELPVDGDGASAVVVGAGPAGLEAARRLALRGFAVTVFERGDAVGGLMHAWSQAPSRREIRQLLQWWERQLDEYRVDLRLGVEATPQHVTEMRPATVVLATGAVAEPELSGPTDGSAMILDAVSALTTDVRGRVAICDTVGALDAMLVAERIAAGPAGHVTLVTGRIHVGEGEGITSLFPLIRRLAELHVAVVERAVPAELAAGRLHLRGVFGESRPAVDVDAVVVCREGRSQTQLLAPLREAGMEPLVVGDALRPRRAHDAVGDGARVGREAPSPSSVGARRLSAT
jgi:2,4-dienoyl-CoA reductase-like NADH-dependent reductase (Old Yellow Enzyme family)